MDVVLAVSQKHLSLLDPNIDFADQDRRVYASRVAEDLLDMWECPPNIQRFLRWAPAICITPCAIDFLTLVSTAKNGMYCPKKIRGEKANIERMIRNMPSPKNQLKVFRRFTFIARKHWCVLYDLYWCDIDPQGDRFLVGRIKMRDGRIGIIRFKWRSARKHALISPSGVRGIPVPKKLPDDASATKGKAVDHSLLEGLYPDVSFALEIEAAEYDSLKRIYEAWLKQSDPVKWLEKHDAIDPKILERLKPKSTYIDPNVLQARKRVFARRLGLTV